MNGDAVSKGPASHFYMGSGRVSLVIGRREAASLLSGGLFRIERNM